MKNIILLFLVFLTNCKAQTIIVPLASCNIEMDKYFNGVYNKDVDNDFNKLEGTWLYQNGNTELLIVLQKKVQYHILYDKWNYYMDYEMLTDLSKSNKLNSYVVLQDRTKKGDTAIFDDILVQLPDSMIVQGVGMKFVIEK